MLGLKITLVTIILTSVLLIGIMSVMNIKLTYGLAGSLENLQNEVSNETGYEKELEYYISSHNASFGVKDGKTLTFDNFDVSEMEEVAKSHMNYCKTTSPAERAKNIIDGYEWALVLNQKMILANC